MTRILIFSTNYFPFVGGAEVAVREITDRLADHTFSMVVPRISPSSLPFERVGAIDVYRIGFGRPFDKFIFPVLGFFKALSLHRKQRFEIGWSIMASQASIAAAFFKMTHASVKLVLTLQEGDEEEYLARYVFGSRFLYRLLIRPWHALVFRKADCVTAISAYLSARAKAMGVTAPVTLVPNGVDLELFVPNTAYHSGEQRAHVREQLGVHENDMVLVTTSRLVEKNGVEDVIRALKSLPSHVYFVVIGSGKLEMKLKALTDDLGLVGRIRFLGALPTSEIPAYLHASDIFIRPSLSEGFGNSFVEAMAAGIPAIGTPVGGIVDFLEDGVTGIMARPNNPTSIEKAVLRLVENPELSKRISAAAFSMVQERYGWGTIATLMRDVFDRCLLK